MFALPAKSTFLYRGVRERMRESERMCRCLALAFRSVSKSIRNENKTRKSIYIYIYTLVVFFSLFRLIQWRFVALYLLSCSHLYRQSVRNGMWLSGLWSLALAFASGFCYLSLLLLFCYFSFHMILFHSLSQYILSHNVHELLCSACFSALDICVSFCRCCCCCCFDYCCCCCCTLCKHNIFEFCCARKKKTGFEFISVCRRRHCVLRFRPFYNLIQRARSNTHQLNIHFSSIKIYWHFLCYFLIYLLIYVSCTFIFCFRFYCVISLTVRV